MIYPLMARACSGLRRAGLFTLRALDHDPKLVYSLTGFLRPRHLILVADSVSDRIEATLHLDTGSGFSDAERIAFRPCGRALFWLDLAKMPELRRVQLGPSSQPGDVRVVALGIASRSIARKLVHRLDRDDLELGPTRVLKLTSTSIRDARPFRNVAEHYSDVLALAAKRLSTDVEAAEAPLVSILVPTFNTDPAHLDALLASFSAQANGLAELILSDDGSTSSGTLGWLEAHASSHHLKVLYGERNEGIAAATNRALQRASAPWVSLADHDDALSPGAVGEIARAIQARPDAQFIYTDEVITDPNLKPLEYVLKPAFDPVLLSGVNYINHLAVYRRERLLAIGGFRDGYQGSQDYDLILRYLEGISAKHILHVPYPAYLWRHHETSFSTKFRTVAVDSARRALGSRYGGPSGPAQVEDALLPSLHRVRFDVNIEHWPKVSAIIPNRDSPNLIAAVLSGLSDTDYADLEIIVADNGTRDPQTLGLYEQYASRFEMFLVEDVPGEFNFSRSVNRGIARASGEFLLLLNNDIEIQDPNWLKEMVSCFRYDGTGVVGARLLYPDRTIQHAGIIVGLGGLAGHWFGGQPEVNWGPMGRFAVRQTLSAVTGAVMLISRACMDATGPFNEEEFAIAYNDVDFCLRAGEKGFRVVWTPFATLIHHESATRGSDEAPDKIERFRREQKNLRQRHGTCNISDPAYNPWHDTAGSVAAIRALDHLPGPR